MSSNSSASLPRKKRSILWFIAGVFLLLLGLFFFQLFGPDPRIVVSRQTTYLTEPLGSNGLPDYERYLLERYREGVTPQNNAAALMWKALWPGELSPQDYAPVSKELGLTQIPSKSDAIDHLYSQANTKRIAEWLKQQAANATVTDTATSATISNGGTADLDEDSLMQTELEHAAEEVLDQVMSRPWTSDEAPPIAAWVRAKQKPLDLLVEASRRPRCYFPSMSLIDAQRGPLIAMLLPGQQGARAAARSLVVRAMWHLGEGRPNEAWQDLLAIHRIGRLLAQGHTVVEQLIGAAFDNIACYGTQTLVHHGNLSVEQLQQIRRELAALPPLSGMAEAIDEGERLGTVDALVHLAVSNDASWNEMLGITGNDAGGLPILQIVSVDWNLVLRDINRWYDRLAAAIRLPNRAERMAAMQTVEADMLRLVAESQRPMKLALAAVSRQQRSEVVAAMMLGIFLPAIDAATAAEDRANATMQLTQLAAALSEYRAVHGVYPENLDELNPSILEKLPVDIHAGSPFFYKRETDGYILYSAGSNRKDDGGSNEQINVYAGQPLNELDDAEATTLHSKIPAGADDISIRLPHPPFVLPFPASRGVPAPEKGP
jgi:hypothetical protein